MTQKLDSQNKIIVFLGAHRSGTSLAARIFEAYGLYLGNSLIPGHADNLEGFWEHGDILAHTRAIEDILDINPTRGVKLLPTIKDWWDLPDIRIHRASLVGILEKELKKNHVFGFKDPRTLVLMPLWQRIFNDIGVEPTYISLLRHPSAVVQSFSKRQGFPLEFAEYVWLLSWSHALKYLDKPIVNTVHFEAWFEKPSAQMEMVKELVKSMGVSIDAGIENDVNSIVNPKHAHHAHKESPLDLKKSTQTVYAMLCDPESYSPSEIKLKAAEIVSDYQKLEPVYNAFTGRSRVAEGRVLELEKKIDLLRGKVRKANTKLEKFKAGKENARRNLGRPTASYALEFPSLREFNQKHAGPGSKLKVCIAVEDIAGPIRNGGIGTTYYHLAKMLANAGHNTTIAYVRGNHSEDGSIQKWVDFYEDLGIKFELLYPERLSLKSASSRWFNPMIVLYSFLQKEHFDLVHCSEWRGTAYLSMSAKSLGIDFQDTIFCIKASSPWLWNREHGYHVLSDSQDLSKIYAEKRSIELADIVVGGSAHLLNWMFAHGYNLPHPHTYVQPNVVVPADLGQIAKDRRELYDTYLIVEEIVFFGRLEYRKGLDVFCDAIDILVASQKSVPPISFVGKYGEKIPAYREMSIEKYLEYRCSNWPTQTNVYLEFDSQSAIEFLLEKQRLAVMPSLIENSSLAVYEAAYYGIPFIASNRGGTPELVPLAIRDNVLTEPHPVPLSRKILEALAQGGFIARPSFDNSRNLATWLRFHAALGANLEEFSATVPESIDQKTVAISVCLSIGDGFEYAEELIESSKSFCPKDSLEFVICNDGRSDQKTIEWLSAINLTDEANVQLVDTEAWGEQHALNRAAEAAKNPLLLFIQPGTFLKENYFTLLQTVFKSADVAVACCYFEEISREKYYNGGDGDKVVIDASNMEYTFFDSQNISPVFMIRKDSFQDIGGFREEFKVSGSEIEMLAEANLKGLNVVTVPEFIASFVVDYGRKARTNDQALPYRSIRAYSEFAPNSFGRLLSLSKGLSNKALGSAGLRSKSDSPIATIFDPDQSQSSDSDSFTSKVFRIQVYCFHLLIRFEMWFLSKLRVFLNFIKPS